MNSIKTDGGQDHIDFEANVCKENASNRRNGNASQQAMCLTFKTCGWFASHAEYHATPNGHHHYSNPSAVGSSNSIMLHPLVLFFLLSF